LARQVGEESRFFVQLDGFDQRRHLPEEHGGLPRQSCRICFGSMPAKSTAPTACLVIDAVTTDQQIETDLLPETTHPLQAT
jgi:hypothetical protein